MTIETMIERFKEQRDHLQETLDALQDGRIRTGRRSIDTSTWTDTTDESIKDCQWKIAELQDIIDSYPEFR